MQQAVLNLVVEVHETGMLWYLIKEYGLVLASISIVDGDVDVQAFWCHDLA